MMVLKQKFRMLYFLLLVCEDSAALTLKELVNNVLEENPVFQAAKVEILEAQGNHTQSARHFDPTLEFHGERHIEPQYQHSRGQVSLLQRSPWLGTQMKFFYGQGKGNFGPYEKNFQTLSGGEFGVALRQPLLNGLLMDDLRFERIEAQKKVSISQANLNLTQIKILSEAVSSYFAWIADQQKLKISQNLLELAIKRQSKLEKRASSGDLAKIVLTDNERLILERKTEVINAHLEVQRAVISLNQYLGEKKQVTQADLDTDLPQNRYSALTTSKWSADLLAWIPRVDLKEIENRPELMVLDSEKTIAEAEHRLGRQQVLPELNLFGQISRDQGRGNPKLGETEHKIGLEIQFPLPMSKGRGRAIAAQARKDSIEYQQQWFRIRTKAEITASIARVKAAQRKLEISARYLEASKELEKAENFRFNTGSSDLIKINIRETATAHAEKEVVSSELELINSAMNYWTSLGRVNIPELFRSIEINASEKPNQATTQE